jgi:4'-phosphopantetheinyl transferase
LEADPERIRFFHEFLSGDERAKAKRFVLERDRRRYIVSRASLRRLLSEYVGIPPDSLQFRYGSCGKPELVLASSEPLFFNLAHSGEISVVAVTAAGRIGVDVEHARSFEMDDLARLFFSPAEAAEFFTLSASQRQQGFFSCWTRKEAYLKACGRGLSIPLNSFAVSLRPGETARLIATGDDPDEAARWTLKDVNVPVEYYASVAVRAPNFELAYRSL